jgi:hypothetical protein
VFGIKSRIGSITVVITILIELLSLVGIYPVIKFSLLTRPTIFDLSLLTGEQHPFIIKDMILCHVVSDSFAPDLDHTSTESSVLGLTRWDGSRSPSCFFLILLGILGP